MFSCVIYGCTNNTLTTTDTGIIYYYFPKHPEIIQRWIEASGWDKEHIDLEHARVCSIHFDEDSYTTEYKVIDFIPCYTKVLKYDAVPTLYLPTTTQIIIKHPLDASKISDDDSDIKQMIVFVPEETQVPQNYEISPCEETRYIELKHSTNKQNKKEKNEEKYNFIKNNEQLLEIKISNNQLRQEITHAEAAAKKAEAAMLERQAEWKEKFEKYKRLKRQYKQLKQKLLIMRHQKSVLSNIFSNSQIKILSGKKKIYWSNDDMAVGYTIRHLSNKRCYSYLTKNLKIPLPALSSIKRWTNLKYKPTLNKNSKIKSDDNSFVESD